MHRIFQIAVIAALLGGCANEAPAPLPSQQGLFHDDLFPAVAILSPDEITALSPEMTAYLNSNILSKSFQMDRRETLITALEKKGNLRLEFDAERTRTASEAFRDRTGNCLSLTLMVGAMAQALGLHPQYQRVITDETWNRVDTNYLLIGHVNIALSPGTQRVGFLTTRREDTVIDFIPSESLVGMRVEWIDEATVVAMFMNNRAVESMVRGDYPAAYAWARAAIVEQPKLSLSYNTLGVIYERAGHVNEAEQVFRQLLARKSTDTLAMANLIPILTGSGRTEEAQKLGATLRSLDPYPAYYYFDQGRTAMRAGDYKTAKLMFQREIDRAPYNDEFHFWMATADASLGDIREAKEELQEALESSTTRRQHDLYATKLMRLSALQNQRAATLSN